MRNLPPRPPGRFRRAVARLVLAAFLATLPGSPPARADFSGANVAAGRATVEQRGNLIWIEASDGSIVQFDLLNVWSEEELHALLPDAQSRILLDVLHGPTQIDGGLFSNGTVYILNPAGIFFGSEAVVDTNGLVAAAGTMSHEDFLAGVDRFELSGPVENAGHIEAPRVALLGTVVANHGDIVAPDGTIALVAGDRVLLTRLGGHLHVEVDGGAGAPGVPAIEQTGTVDAGGGDVSFTTGDVWSLAINHEGVTRGRNVELRAEGGTVRVSGEIDASDRSAGATGGSIAVTGERVALLGAKLDASGDAGGGRIHVGGGRHGGGVLANARRTYVDEGSVLRADATGEGDGGEVVVWSDEATAFHGRVSARGGALGGDGGFAEISGGRALWSDGDVDLRAPHGETGTLLYDPQDIEIVGGAADGSDAPDAADDAVAGDDGSLGQVLFGDEGDLSAPFQIHESEIEGTDANVVLEARNSIASTGTFTNEVDGEGVGVLLITGGHDLTLTTQNHEGDADGSAATPGIDLAGLALRTKDGGSVALSTGDGSIAVGSIDTSGADGATGGDAGSIQITAGDADRSGTSDVTVTGDLLARGGHGTAGAGGAGGAVTVRSEGASVELNPGEAATEVVQGGGAIALANVDTRGGGSDTGAGGAGGSIAVDTTDGAIATGALDASGGDGADTGGNAGQIALTTTDADQDNANAVTTGALTARGGAGGAGAGGAGGRVSARAVASPQVFSDDDMNPATDPVVIQEALGGGDVTVGAVDASGGAGSRGGAAGAVTLAAAGTSQVGAEAGIAARGGSGSAGDGGVGGRVRIGSQDGDVRLGAVDTRGGDGNGSPDALGGGGGTVSASAGEGEDASGDLLLLGNIDAREGASAAADDTVAGGAVVLFAADSLEHGGQAGPHVTTSDHANVTLEATDVGADGTFRVRGGDSEFNTFFLRASGRADVETEGFGSGLGVTATSASADIDVVQTGAGGADVVDLSGDGSTMTVNQVDTTANATPVQVALENPDDAAPDGTLQIATGSVTAGRDFIAFSDGDLVVGDADGTAIAMRAFADPDAPGEPTTPGLLSLQADVDGDGTGALRDAAGAATGRIDLLGDADEAGAVLLGAAEGIGDVADPLTFVGGGDLTGLVRPRKAEDAPADPENPDFVPDPDATGGLFARNEGSGDLTVVGGQGFDGAVVDAGTGSIGIANAADGGDLVVEGRVSAKPPEGDGAGGDVTLAATGADAKIVLDTGFPVESGGQQVYDGDVALRRNATLDAPGGVDFRGAIDTADDAFTETALAVTFGGTAALRGTVGGSRALGSLVLSESEQGAGTVRVDADSVRTVGDQTYGADAEVGAPDTAFQSDEGIVAFQGDLDAAADAGVPPGVAVEARRALFGGDVGGARPLGGLDVLARDGTGFVGSGDQTVATGDGGIRFDTGRGAFPPPTATVGKAGGGLSLESTGSVEVADGQKLSVEGDLAIAAPTVRVTDLSALSIDIASPQLEVFARQPGSVLARSGGTFRDGGTDILANRVRFSSAPTVVGAGPAPRIATASGTAEGAGALAVSRLPAPVAGFDLLPASGDQLLDLAIPFPDPGHETPELEGGPVEVPQPLRIGEAAAAPGAAPTPAEVVAFLACARTGGRAARPGCGEPPRPRPGSVLDTPRAAELASAYRELLGDAPAARAGRSALAEAAGRPGPLYGAATPEAGRRYLAEVAQLLARARLLGLDDAARDRLRHDLLAAVRDAVGAPGLDLDRLEAAVRASRPGLRV